MRLKYVLMVVFALFISGCSLVPDLPGPIGIPGL
jgi:hypothetical protein